ncbi:hypothetical protein ABW20_dc0107744 [Dactylellina cionopaga]|nr:hypothetical protein ABW20_dc0107744 [Dactylellina cionopaga]
MRGEVGAFALITTSLFAIISGAALPKQLDEPYEILDRTHYNVRSLDIINHIYGETSLQKRDNGEHKLDCGGGTAHHLKSGEISHCKYSIPVERYNQAIGELHSKLARRNIKDFAPVYLSNSSRAAQDPRSTNPQPQDKRQVINDVDVKDTFPPGSDGPWSWGGTKCYSSGMWARNEMLGSIRGLFCDEISSNIRGHGAVTSLAFFNGVSIQDGVETSFRLTSIAGTQMIVTAEFIPAMQEVPPFEIGSVCKAVVYRLIYDECQGAEEDTRGGRLSAIRTPNSPWAPREYWFGLDPNEQWNDGN